MPKATAPAPFGSTLRERFLIAHAYWSRREPDGFLKYTDLARRAAARSGQPVAVSSITRIRDGGEPHAWLARAVALEFQCDPGWFVFGDECAAPPPKWLNAMR